MLRKAAAVLLLAIVFILPSAGIAGAARTDNVYSYRNDQTGHYAVILDQAGLLSSEEEGNLEPYLNRMTEYCSAIFFTGTEDHSDSMYAYSKSMMEKIGRSVGMANGYEAVIFVVDMNKRELYIYAGETTAKVITTGISNSITDNTYSYASRREYFEAAKETFSQLYQVLDGQVIAQPMKYITSALLAVFAGLGISLVLVRSKTKRRVASSNAIMDSLEVHWFEPTVSSRLLSEKKVIHVEHSGGGGGGHGGGFSGGGGGGGGFSGGGSGGGHSF